MSVPSIDPADGQPPEMNSAVQSAGESAEPMAAELPTATPEAKVPQPLPPAGRKLRYFAAFRYLFESPDWLHNLLLSSVCLFIPVFGQVAVLGWYYEIVERLHRNPSTPCPKFLFSRFGLYSSRGVWSYLLLMAVTTTLQPLLQVPAQYTVFGIIIAFQSSNTTGAIVSAILAAFWLVILAMLFLLIVYFMQPLMLRGGMSQDLVQMFRMKWVLNYSRRVWLEILLVQALVVASMCMLMPFGVLLFFVGVFPVSVWISVAASHLIWQVYELYLERGGERIPLRPMEADVPPVVQPATNPVGIIEEERTLESEA